jgi:nitrite reductase/ring-hydroxylating ferredoxin subunit
MTMPKDRIASENAIQWQTAVDVLIEGRGDDVYILPVSRQGMAFYGGCPFRESDGWCRFPNTTVAAQCAWHEGKFTYKVTSENQP